MTNMTSPKASGYLISAAVAATTAVTALPAAAYNLHSENGTELNLDVEAIFGTFSSQENYFGKAGDGSDWQEAYIKAGLSSSHRYNDQGASVYGAVNVFKMAGPGWRPGPMALATCN